MGIFQHFKPIFNRAPVRLFVMFDAQREPIPPGAYELPEQTIYYAKNQNPIMGSADPNDPTMAGARYLIVEEGEDGFGVPLTDEEWAAHLGRPCRIDEEAAFQERYGNDPRAKLVVRGKGRKSTATSRADAGGAYRGNAEFTRKEA